MEKAFIHSVLEFVNSRRPSLDLSYSEVESILAHTPNEIALCNSVEGLKSLRITHKNQRDQGEEQAYYRLNQLLLQMIETEETVDGIKKLYKDSILGSQAHAAAFLKWHKLSLQEMESATNPTEIERAVKKAPMHSEAHHLYAKRMLEFAETPEKALEMLGYAGEETIRRIAHLLKNTT